MLSIDWRAPVAYAHAKSIPPAGFAWEYLRRHDEYDRDFQTLSAMSEPAASRLEASSRRWGLRFPVRPRRPR